MLTYSIVLAAESRPVIKLSNIWKCCPVVSAKKPGECPPDGKFTKVTLPKDKFWMNSDWIRYQEINYPSLKAKKGSNWCWYKQNFLLPENFNKGQIYLQINGIYFQYYIWLNGKKIGSNIDGTLPRDFDITNAVNFKANNELVILAGDARTLEDDAPHGGMARYERGLIDNIYVYSVNKNHIKDIFVKTSYRKKHIDVDLDISASWKKLKPHIEVVDSTGKKVPLEFKKLPDKSSWRAVWTNPHLWSPDDPYLYRLKVALVNSNGNIVDTKDVRFGFREFWIEGPSFFLNGKKTLLKQQFSYIGNYLRAFRMKGKKHHAVDEKYYLNFLKSKGVNAVRYHSQPFPRKWVDAADETGMLVLAGTLLNHGPVSDKSAQHVHNLVKAYRNHPSIVIWSLNNEFVHWVNPRLKHVSAFLDRIEDDVNQLDPTRPAQHSGYGEFSPRQDVINIHYPAPRDKVLLPNCFHWMRTGNYINDIYKDHPWKKDKPLLIGEQLLPWEGEIWTMLGGDRIYKEPHYNLKNSKILAQVMGQVYRMMVENARVGNLAMVSVLSGRNLSNQWYKEKAYIFDPQDGFIMQRGLRFWSGEERKLDYFAWNDAPGKLTGKLTCNINSGFIPANTDLKVNLEPGYTEKYNLALKAPETDGKIIRAKLNLQLKDAIDQKYAIGAFPLKYDKLNRNGILFLSNKKSEIEFMNKSFALDGKLVNTIKPELLKNTTVLILSGTLLPKLAATNLKVISSFCKAGGKAIILAPAMADNSCYEWMPIPLTVSAIPLTITFPRVFSRLLFKDIEQNDLRFWRDDNIVADYSFNIPVSGNFTPLCDAGSSSGMSLTSLLEMRQGKGILWASSYSFIKKMKKDPAAMLLFSNLLNYSLKIKPVAFKSTIVALEGNSEQLRHIIKKFRLEADFYSRPLNSNILRRKELIITNGRSISRLLPIKEARKFLKSGGTIYIHLLRNGQKAWLEKLTGNEIRFSKYKSSCYIPDLRNNSLARGMSISDLDWGDSQKQAFAPIADFRIVPGKNWKDVVQLFKSPGLVFKLPYGGGKIIIDQTKWDMEDLKSTRAQRFGSMLLSNLGVKMQGVPYMALKNLKYKTLALGDKYNSSFGLDTARRMVKYFDTVKAGKGNIPGLQAVSRTPGMLTFKYDGIPFKLKLSKQRCITVTCPKKQYTKVKGVDNIQLPRGDTLIESIYFFHISRINWSVKLQRFIKIGNYRINYMDGTTVDIPIERQINTAHYRRSYPQGLPNAKMVMLMHDALNNKACLLCTSWRNPFPGKKIRSIDLLPGLNFRNQPFLFAVTVKASDYKYE
jgi:hypothetical protein